MRIFLLSFILLLSVSCTTAGRIEKRHLWWEEQLNHMVELKMNKVQVENFLNHHNVSNSYVANEQAFYIMEKGLHKWVIGYTDLMVRIYLARKAGSRAIK